LGGVDKLAENSNVALNFIAGTNISITETGGAFTFSAASYSADNTTISMSSSNQFSLKDIHTFSGNATSATTSGSTSGFSITIPKITYNKYG
jgi:FlaG/FlaF family flagellin (archaellin)